MFLYGVFTLPIKTLMSDNPNSRWSIASLDLSGFTVTVSDSQLKRRKTYHIPYLTHAIIKNDHLMVATSFNKIMAINLLDGSRKFVT